MKLYVEVNGKIIDHFDILRESLSDFLKRKKLGTNFKISREAALLSLESIKDDLQLKLDIKK